MKKSTSITKKDLENTIGGLETSLERKITGLGTNLDRKIDSVRSDLKDFRDYTVQRFNKVDNRLENLESDMTQVKDALIDLSDTDQQVHNLVRELKGQNIKLNEKRIFAA